MRLHTGTSGFSYKEWKGSFYPEDLPASAMLAYYAERFPSVEINNTFYRMPTEKVLLDWAAQVPESFSFVLKAPRQITHIKRLKEVADPVAFFLKTSSVLGARRGPLLFQLPPNMKKDVARLEALFESLPPDCRTAIEFRNDSWFDDDVYSVLRAHGSALCVAHTEEGDTPFEATATWGYLRLRGVQYEDAALQAWVERVKEQAWSDAYVFFKHEDEATGPKLAVRFGQMFGS